MAAFTYPKTYDIIVIGGGHAGCEAALAAARMGSSVLLTTINLDTIAQMSCNPSIGGLAKGHLVREIDALGGEMAKVTDRTYIQFRMLNTSKGPAVWAPRAQSDKKAYQFAMKHVIENQSGLDVKQELVTDILTSDDGVCGVRGREDVEYRCRVVVVCSGTFLRGLIHIGDSTFPSGRAGEIPSNELSESLEKLGFELGRLKTGTPSRLNGRTIDFSRCEIQHGDGAVYGFSHQKIRNQMRQVPCHITWTNRRTAEIIEANLERSPLYSGKITGIGPRYCPSIETKVVRFPDKERHQVFLEPEGLNTEEIYANGISTSLPYDVQLNMVHSIPGLEHAEMMRPGYAIEYDFAPPVQVTPSLETKHVDGLFFAGQINGTSGYEEAAAQGLMAGINAVRKLKGDEPVILDRSQAYIGVLIDDLVTKGTDEPYRMFTSRAEYRLLLRQDNADVRLLSVGHDLGLVGDQQFEEFVRRRELIEKGIGKLEQTMVGNQPLSKLLRRPEMTYALLKSQHPEEVETLDPEVERQIELEVKYQGYINKQREQVVRFEKSEKQILPKGIDYSRIKGLRSEAAEKLTRIRPRSIGQASRISGINPADITVLLVHMKKLERGASGQE
jgi:tRNA uridine 5-carboxymethylaminomethyl modification enzyme